MTEEGQKKRAIALYNVCLKVLIKKGDEILFLIDADGKHLELPGGRIDEGEGKTPLEAIIAREIKEELGDDLKYKLGKIAFQFRRHFEKIGLHVFITVYEARYLSGEIVLSDEHTQYKWVNSKEFEIKQEDFFQDEEYFAIKNYFDN